MGGGFVGFYLEPFSARYPDMLQSTTIVDIGPDASRKNIADTVTGRRYGA